MLYTTAKDNTLYYFDSSGAHKYAKTYRRFDILKKAYKELSTTPVYSYKKVVDFYKVKPSSVILQMVVILGYANI